MDFDLSEELTALRDSVRRLSKDKVRPRAREIDETGLYPDDIFAAFRDAGLLGLCIPVEYGGSGAGIMGLTLAIEEVTKYSNVLGLMLLLTRLPTGPIMIAGNEEQKQKYLPGIANGTQRAAFCLSEPGAGSDVAGMRTRAIEDPDHEGSFRLSGTKCWISGGMQADWFVVISLLITQPGTYHLDEAKITYTSGGTTGWQYMYLGVTFIVRNPPKPGPRPLPPSSVCGKP